jgi:hypothetical protein
VHLHSSAACIGQGMGTVQTQFVKEITGLPLEQIIYHAPDTALAPNSGNTTASRQTLFTGEATVRAAKLLKTAMEQSGGLEALEGQSFYGEYEGKRTRWVPISPIRFTYRLRLRYPRCGAGRRRQSLLCYRRARRWYGGQPVALEGQIEGGVVMSLGYALTEDFPLENGRPTKKFGTLGLFKANNSRRLRPLSLANPAKTALPAAKRRW